MNHFVEAYLKRLAPEKMECLVQTCLQEEVEHRYGTLLPEILLALLERESKGELFISLEDKESLERQLGADLR